MKSNYLFSYSWILNRFHWFQFMLSTTQTTWTIFSASIASHSFLVRTHRYECELCAFQFKKKRIYYRESKLWLTKMGTILGKAIKFYAPIFHIQSWLLRQFEALKTLVHLKNLPWNSNACWFPVIQFNSIRSITQN